MSTSRLLLIALAALTLFSGFAYWRSDVVRTPVPRTVYAVDESLGLRPKKDSMKTERDQGIADMTLGDADSSWKPIRIMARNIKDTTGRYKILEHIMSLRKNQHYIARDSAFVIEGVGCIKITVALGQTAADEDTVFIEDTCSHYNPCIAPVTLRVGCWTTERVEAIDTIVYELCDTVCRELSTRYCRYQYYLATPYQLASLHAATFSAYGDSCLSAPQAVPLVNFVKRADGMWYGLTSAGCRPIGAGLDSCLIPRWIVDWYQQRTSGTGADIYYADTVQTATDSVDVDCDLAYGQPNVVRVIQNCRDTTEYRPVVRVIPKWVDGGKDTTIWDDTCDCMIPRMTCNGIVYDTVATWTKFLRPDTIRDTVKEICMKDYVIPVVNNVLWLPRGDDYRQFCNPTDTTALGALVQRYGSATDSAGSWVRVYVSSPCYIVDCAGLWDELPLPFGGFRRFVPSWALGERFGCRPPGCYIDTTHVHTTNWCCAKDTTLILYCGEPGAPYRDSLTLTYSTPDLSVLCHDSTVVGTKPRIKWILDSIATYTISETPGAYAVEHKDTCFCDGTFIRTPVGIWKLDCDTLDIVFDCGLPWYKDAEGRMHIPCASQAAADQTEERLAFLARAVAMAANHADSAFRQTASTDTLKKFADAMTSIAELYVTDASPISKTASTAEIWYELTGMSVGEYAPADYAMSDSTITITNAGLYRITFTSSLSVGTAGRVVHLSLFTTAGGGATVTQQTKCTAAVESPTNSYMVTATAVCVLRCAADDALSLRYKADTNSTAIAIDHLNFNIQRLH